jgi:DNA-binding winged helix-turn-helix (wHTH) protein/tetratricopeptide (TPR) repeat protein
LRRGSRLITGGKIMRIVTNWQLDCSEGQAPAAAELFYFLACWFAVVNTTAPNLTPFLRHSLDETRAMTMPETLLRFGRFEVDVVGRSLRVDGSPVAVEPRPFDVLAHLIDQRHRVVSKQELLEKVWPGRRVSVSALVRAVMKLRQAIGDADEAPLIRTVQRVGYRFVAPSIGEATQPALAADALTLALLPFENATGDMALGWVELGLMAMVAKALSRDRRLSLVGMESLLGTLAAQGESSVAARAAAVQRDTGAQLVVHGRVGRTATGYRLDFRLYGQAHAPASSVTASQPTGLATGLAQALTQGLFREVLSSASAPVRFLDPMVAEAYARGLHAAAEQRWTPAANLFRMALDLEPGHPALQLELLRVLAPIATVDVEVERLAAELLARAERDKDPLVAARVHQAVGRFHLDRKSFGSADSHLQLALKLADGRESSDWTAQTLLLRGSVSFQLFRFAAAHEQLDRVRELCEHSGNRILALAAISLEGCLVSREGKGERALQLSAEVARGARAMRAHRYLCDACGNASVALAEMGRLSEAAAYAEEGLAAALALGDRRSIDEHGANACWIYRLAGEPRETARLLATLDAVQTPVHRQEAVWRARGYHAACIGDAHEAARCFGIVVQLARAGDYSLQEQDSLPWFIEALILTDRTDDARAEIRHAQQLAAQGNRELQVHLLLLRALLAHRQGRPDAALEVLEQTLAAQPAPLWRAWACADAAWLLAEAGNMAAATEWLARIDTPLANLPVVLAARARVLDATHTHHAHGSVAPCAVPRASTLPSRL